VDDIRTAQLARVWWIGGGTDAGKTSVARELALQHRLPVYHYDAHDARQHLRLAEQSSEYAAFLTQTLEERWVQPSPEELLARSWQSHRPGPDAGQGTWRRERTAVRTFGIRSMFVYRSRRIL
jgi:hypothetical protein